MPSWTESKITVEYRWKNRIKPMIDPKKIRKGDIVATKRQSIIVERIEGEGENLAFYGKICNKFGCPSGKTSIYRHIYASVIYRVTRGASSIMTET